MQQTVHNLTEVLDGVIAKIDNPEITMDEMMEYIKGPDFPTGASIMGKIITFILMSFLPTCAKSVNQAVS